LGTIKQKKKKKKWCTPNVKIKKKITRGGGHIPRHTGKKPPKIGGSTEKKQKSDLTPFPSLLGPERGLGLGKKRR